jgi:hypothetical protein
VNAVKTIAMAATLLLIITCSAQEGHGSQRDTRCCLLEVLHSEELSIGPLLYHIIKVAFLVTAPDVTPFETTVLANADAPAGPTRAAWRDPAIFNRSFGFFWAVCSRSLSGNSPDCQ